MPAAIERHRESLADAADLALTLVLRNPARLHNLQITRFRIGVLTWPLPRWDGHFLHCQRLPFRRMFFGARSNRIRALPLALNQYRKSNPVVDGAYSEGPCVFFIGRFASSYRIPTSKHDVVIMVDARDLYGGLIRLHVLQHAGQTLLYGQWMIEELRRHGYEIGSGTIYPLLHSLARKGYLRPKQERSGSRYRKVYRITTTGRRALTLARRRVQELFGEMFSRRRSS
jgi:PadR family transcriptional regulator PadR